ncbi:MAG: DegV family protein [bacterium]|nr:DegV family protein [bacterium]
MTYKIIGDSCLDLTEELKKDTHFMTVPLTLQVGDYQVIDDENFNQSEFLKAVKASSECPKTACPSPEQFKEAYECEEENIFVITLSEHLSGTYNCALLAKKLYEEEHGPKNIFVMSSDSASAGELKQALSIREWCEEGLPFEEICKRALKLKESMKTYFVLETLDTLRKNGRLNGLQAFFATALNIKPVMGAEHGVIIKLDQARGINKALNRMAELLVKEAGDTREKTLVIAHCNNLERAKAVKQMVSEKAEFKQIVITQTAGVATVYANDGGIVAAV